MLHNIKCKRIIGGKTYNTETATQVHGYSTSPDDSPWEAGIALYQHGLEPSFPMSSTRAMEKMTTTPSSP